MSSTSFLDPPTFPHDAIDIELLVDDAIDAEMVIDDAIDYLADPFAPPVVVPTPAPPDVLTSTSLRRLAPTTPPAPSAPPVPPIRIEIEVERLIPAEIEVEASTS